MNTYGFSFFAALLLTIMMSCSDSTDDPTTTPNPPSDGGEPDPTAEVAPDFSLSTYNGGTVKLSDFKDEVLVIFFFGNTCPPCIAVAPDVEEKLNKAFEGESKYNIIGIDVWDGNAASVEGFRDKGGVSFPLALNGSGVGSQYGAGRDRLVVVDQSGNIAFKGAQIAANDMDAVVSQVTALLN